MIGGDEQDQNDMAAMIDSSSGSGTSSMSGLPSSQSSSSLITPAAVLVQTLADATWRRMTSSSPSRSSSSEMPSSHHPQHYYENQPDHYDASYNSFNHYPNDYFAVEREEHRWLEEQQQGTASDDGGGSSSGNNTLAIFSAVMTNVLLFFLIFCLSATVNLKDLKHQLSNRFAIGTGVAMQFIIMPLLGFVSILMFHRVGFTQAMGVSLLVVTASPGGSYSNWWCSLFNASLALSVGMTSVSSLLSIGLLPANLCLYGYLAYGVIIEGDDVDIVGALDFGAIFITLGVVMGAILSGLYVGYKYDNAKFHRRINYVGSVCGITLILFSAFLGSGVDGAETNFWSLPWSFYVGTAFPCAVGMALANIVARTFSLPFPEIVAISIECCYQNTAIATSVAVTMFTDPTARAEAVSVPLFYGVVEAVIIGFYCLWAWKAGWTKAPADEKLCVVMVRTYEVQNGEDDNHNNLTFESEEISHLNWWQKCFVPKYRYGDTNSSSKSLKAGQHPSTDETRDGTDDGRDETNRNRFYSADTTVASSLATPPGTPDIGTISEVSSSDEDDPETGAKTVRTATSRSVLSGTLIPVIDEEEEDSSQDGGGALTPKSITLQPTLNASAFVPDLGTTSEAEGVLRPVDSTKTDPSKATEHHGYSRDDDKYGLDDDDDDETVNA